MAQITRTYDLLNVRKFNQGSEFIEPADFEGLREKQILSDHAQIFAKVKFTEHHGSCLSSEKQEDEYVVGSWNVSNRYHHHYFNEGPFKHTHMAPKNYTNEDEFNKWLDQKEDEQVKIILDTLNEGGVIIQVIQEANLAFKEKLRAEIEKRKLYFDVYDPFNDQKGEKQNRTLVIVASGVVKDISVVHNSTKVYSFVEHTGHEKRIESLFFNLQLLGSKDDTIHKLTLVPVHVPGCEDQFPENALHVLRKNILDFVIENDCHRCLIIGDFNTTTHNVSKIFSLGCFQTVMPTHPTHINPRSEIVTYDNAVIGDFLETSWNRSFTCKWLLHIDSNEFKHDTSSKSFVKALLKNRELSVFHGVKKTINIVITLCFVGHQLYKTLEKH